MQMMSKRDEHVQEISVLERALKQTSSAYLKRDYRKAIRRKKLELEEYDKLHRQSAQKKMVV